jgi:hypothetical protein
MTGLPGVYGQAIALGTDFHPAGRTLPHSLGQTEPAPQFNLPQFRQ